MKKIIALLLFSFAVVAYASPPPEPTPIMFSDQVQLIVQNDYQVVPTFEAQEVAYVYTGNIVLLTGTSVCDEPVYKIALPQIMIVDLGYFKLNKLNKPPSFSCNNMAGSSFNNLQNRKYNYPLRADIFS